MLLLGDSFDGLVVMRVRMLMMRGTYPIGQLLLARAILRVRMEAIFPNNMLTVGVAVIFAKRPRRPTPIPRMRV